MRKTVTVGIIALMLLLGTGVIAASSFTTATLERNANIDVVGDTDGVIALVDGNSGAVVQYGTNGDLVIDFTVGSAQGVNVNSTYELGDPNDPSNERAFNITNNDGVSHTIELDYTVTSGDLTTDGVNQTEFLVFDSTGTNVLTISEEDNGGSFTAASGESFAVVVVVDTTLGTVSDTHDLSGTLNVTAT